MVTKICAEIFTFILFCLEQLVAEKCVVWGQYLCRIAMNTRFSFLTKFYSNFASSAWDGDKKRKMGQRASPAHKVVFIH